MEHIVIEDFSHYLRVVREKNIHDITLFRGQSLDKPLNPKVGRIKSKTGLDVSIMEQRLINEFRRLSLPHLHQNRPQNDWEWLSIAQHHGLATRLLDWSINPLAALWFAVENPPQKRDEGGVVYILVPDINLLVTGEEMDKLSPFNITNTRVIRPANVANRLNAQQGWFTVHMLHQTAKKRDSFIPLELQSRYKRDLVKLSISPDKFAEFRLELSLLGTNRATLFPDLDGLTSHLNWVNSALSDEMSIRRSN